MTAEPADSLRMLVVAPFERGKGHGGSQRATALAERMEDRGVHVQWNHVRASPTSRRQKLIDTLRLQPMHVGFYPRQDASLFDVDQRSTCQIALAAHSFIAPQLDQLPDHVTRVTDFHNLEWDHLADSARLERRFTARGTLRALHLAVQVRLLRRFEREIIRRDDLSLFVSSSELQWGRRSSPDAELLLVPSVLPRATEDEAVTSARRRESLVPLGKPRFVYVGTLTFPPNVMSLKHFLHGTWPEIRRASPAVELEVVGDAPSELRAEIDRVAGARALGYVADLAPVLERCAGALMPFEGRAGTSLRVLHYALARIPVIGTTAAFRGFDASIGIRANTPEQWAEAVRRLIDHGASRAEYASLTDVPYRTVLNLQRDPVPWDRLRADLGRLAQRTAAAVT